MKVYKWKKADLDPIKLLRRVDAVVDNQAYPSFVFISPKRYAEMKRYVYQQFKKQSPYSSKQKLLYNTELHLLNFSPCELKGLPDTIIVVNNKGIQESYKQEGKDKTNEQK